MRQSLKNIICKIFDHKIERISTHPFNCKLTWFHCECVRCNELSLDECYVDINHGWN